MPQSITDVYDGLSFPSLQLRLSPRRYQTDGLSFPSCVGYTTPALAATLSNIIDGLLFHLRYTDQ